MNKKIYVLILLSTCWLVKPAFGQGYSVVGETLVCPEPSEYNYSFGPSDKSPTWNITGGTIISQVNANTVRVKWHNTTGIFITAFLQTCVTVDPPPYEDCNGGTQWVCDWDWELQQNVNCRWESWGCVWVDPPPYDDCTSNSGSLNVAVATPANYTVNGGGAYCYEQTAPSVGLPNSQSGYTYYLEELTSINGSVKALRDQRVSSGGALNFTNVRVLPDQSTTNDSESYYRIRAVSPAGCENVMSGQVTITRQGAPSGGSVSSSAELFAPASGTLFLSGQIGSVAGWQQKTGSGDWVDAGQPNSVSYPYSALTQSTQYRAKISRACTTVFSSPALITVYTVPVITAVGATGLSYGGGSTVTLTTSSNYFHYQWYKNGGPMNGQTGSQLVVTEPGNYSVYVMGSATSPEKNSNVLKVGSLGAQEGFNILSTTFVAKPGVHSADELFGLARKELAQSVNYMDGLGRTQQSIAIGQSPQQHDILKTADYNQYGQTSVDYLPFATSSATGAYQSNVPRECTPEYTSGSQYQFYQNTSKVAGSTAPYSKTSYEQSPLGRVLKQGAPGTEWQPNSDALSLNDHTVKNKYAFNAANEVVMLNYNATDGSVGVGSVTHYTAGQLAKTITYDEANHQVVVYTDKSGKTVLKKVQSSGTPEAPVFAETYYIYNDFGKLVVMLPPEGVKKLKQNLNLN